MLEQYWEKHPFQHEMVAIIREGEWVTHVFEWIFMMVSRFAGYLMTLAVGYLIFYAIETKHSLDAIPAHPAFADQIAIYSNVIINVTPELVFPGVVVLCIRAFTVRRWIDAVAYLITTIAFVILTMVLLNAFMNGQITKDFLAAMLFWRAGAALAYTVVVAYCGGHGGLDFKTLLRELDTLRGQLDGGQQTVSSLQQQLSSVQQRASTLEEQLSTERKEASRLRRELDTEQQRANKLQAELESGEGDVARLRRELNAALVDADTLRTQLDGKQKEVDSLREMVESGQEWQGSRVSTLQQQLSDEQNAVVTLRRQLNTAQLDVEGLRAKLNEKQRDVERVQSVLSGERQEASRLRQALETEQSQVSTLKQQLSSVQQEVSTLREKLSSVQVSSIQSVQASSGQVRKVDSGQATQRVDGGQGKVLKLDTSRQRKNGQDDSAIAEQIRELLDKEPGLSGRAIASRVGCSPTTAAKWKAFFEGGGQTEAVNE
jgi:predicted  nucleic acid-binding Zn-ribbon protein